MTYQKNLGNLDIISWLPIIGNQSKNRKEKAIQNALNCKGWTSEAKLSLLYDLVQKVESLPGEILEIGSAWGRSLVLFGFGSEKLIWSIDPHTGGRAFIERSENQNSFAEFLENIKKFKLESRVKILKNTTKEVLELQLIPKQVKFSFIFIDGLHTAEGVKIDFDYSYERLVEGGIIAFDDYFEPSIPDYSQMIDSLVYEHKLDFIKDEVARLAYIRK